MIARIWHGWTTTENAKKYEHLLRSEVFPGIANKNVKGYRKISLLSRPSVKEVEFITIMFFNDLKAVKEFAGEDYEKSYVPDKAKLLLARHDATAQHYEILHELNYV